MVTALIIATLFCFLVPVYVYFGYPLLLLGLIHMGFSRSVVKKDLLPSVTLIISCYNEAKVIRNKLENTLSLNYPQELFTILVVSDASDDGTDGIVKEYESKGIRLIRQQVRLGKTMGLNLAMKEVSSEVIVFSDANAIYDKNAIRKLVRSFADEKVGYIVGAALYSDHIESASGKNENFYWCYELAIKNWESQLHSVVGGDGAIYAIRHSLWQPLQAEDINDFVNPLQIIAQGYRGVFEEEAWCSEETAGSFDKEAARKERIVNRSVRGLIRVSEIMNPVKSGFFSLEVISHKLLRWLIPFFLLLAFTGCALLSIQGVDDFQIPLIGAIAFLLLALVGSILEKKNITLFLFSTPYYFILVNMYSMRGILAALQGKTQVTWNSTRVTTSKNSKHELKPLVWMLASVGILGISLMWSYLV